MKQLKIGFAGLIAVAVAVSTLGAEEFPEGAKGFAGLINGKVVSKTNDEVVVRVMDIKESWKQSKAKAPESMLKAKITLKINPELYKNKEGYLPKVRKFFETREIGENYKFDIKHAEGAVFTFMELTKRQLEGVEGKGDKTEAKPKKEAAPAAK